MMRSLTAIVLSWLHQVAIAVWLGGALTLGIVVAPAVFGAAKEAGHTARGMALYDFAAVAMGEVFERFNYAVLAAGVVALLAGTLYGVVSGRWDIRILVRTALTAIAFAIALWLTFSLYPQLLVAREAGNLPQFDAMHETYSLAFRIQVILLLGGTALTAWMHLRPQAGAAQDAAVPVTGATQPGKA